VSDENNGRHGQRHSGELWNLLTWNMLNVTTLNRQMDVFLWMCVFRRAKIQVVCCY
jgi:hypothetical protein